VACSRGRPRRRARRRGHRRAAGHCELRQRGACRRDRGAGRRALAGGLPPDVANRGVVRDLQRHGAENPGVRARPGSAATPATCGSRRTSPPAPFRSVARARERPGHRGRPDADLRDARRARRAVDGPPVRPGGRRRPGERLRARALERRCGGSHRAAAPHSRRADRGRRTPRRAWDRVALDVLRRAGTPLVGADTAIRAEDRPMVAVAIAGHADRRANLRRDREAAPTARGTLWPWEEVSHSRAKVSSTTRPTTGLAVVEGMLLSGGWPVLVNEEDVERANHWRTGPPGSTCATRARRVSPGSSPCSASAAAARSPPVWATSGSASCSPASRDGSGAGHAWALPVAERPEIVSVNLRGWPT